MSCHLLGLYWESVFVDQTFTHADKRANNLFESHDFLTRYKVHSNIPHNLPFCVSDEKLAWLGTGGPVDRDTIGK